MRTLQVYFGKLATGYCGVQAAEKHLPNTPKKAYFATSEEMCFSNFPK